MGTRPAFRHRTHQLTTRFTSKVRRWRLLPNGSFPRLPTMDSFRGRYCALRKECRSQSTCLTRRTRRSNCTGMGSGFRQMWMGLPRKGHRLFPRTGCGESSSQPGPAGFRFYHTHNRAGADLAAGQYSGQVGPVYIEPKSSPGNYDREVFIVLKEFEPTFSRGGDMDMNFLAPAGRVKSLEEDGRVRDEGVSGEWDAARI